MASLPKSRLSPKDGNPEVLMKIHGLALQYAKDRQPVGVQYEEFPAGMRWVLHLDNGGRLEVFVPGR